MKKLLKICSIICLTLLSLTACNEVDTINADMITLVLPESVRNCPSAPRSPGGQATKKQVARFIVELYNSWEECHGDLKAVNDLYLRYRDELDKFDLKTGDRFLDNRVSNILRGTRNASKKSKGR